MEQSQSVPRRCWAVALACMAITSGLGAAEDPMRELELTYLRPALAPALLPYAHLEVAAIEQLQISQQGGKPCLGLRVFHGQPLKNGGVRAEVSVDMPYHVGDTLEYQWSFFIPKDFPSDAPQNRWWVLADWHDQPNRERGETWDGFPSRSAPIILGYGQLNGKDLISLSYGSPDPQPQAAFPVQRERWQTLTVRIAWAQDSSGKASVRLDGTTVASASGPNMHNDFQHYLKLGMYRHPEIAGDNWLYVSQLQIRAITKD